MARISFRIRTEAYIRHWLMRYYLELVKVIARYEIIIAWYEIIKTSYAKIITLYAILQRNDAIFITRNAIIKFKRVILTQDRKYFSRENVKISRDINFSWKYSRDIQYVIQSRFIYHVIRTFISRNTEPDVCIRGFSFIFEMDTENMAASVSILHTNYEKVCVELIVRVPYNIYWVVTAGPRNIRS